MPIEEPWLDCESLKLLVDPNDGADCDVDSLRIDFSGVCTDAIRKETSGDPSFPVHRTVAEITEDDIDLLQRWIELKAQDRYSYWRRVFVEINLLFDRAAAESLISQTRSDLPDPVPFAPAFLLLAEACLSIEDKTMNAGRSSAKSFRGAESPVLAKQMFDCFHGDNIPGTRRDVAHGKAVIHATAGLIDLISKHWHRDRGAQKRALVLLGTWGLVVSGETVRNWRTRGSTVP